MLRQTIFPFNACGMAALLGEAPHRVEEQKTDVLIVGYIRWASHWVGYMQIGSCPFGCGFQRRLSEEKRSLPRL